jgi:cytochrome P450
MTTARMALTLGRITGEGTARETRAAVRGLRIRVGRGVPGGAARTDFDPFDDAVLADPYPAFARLLEGPRLQYSPKRRVWIVGRHEDVRAAARAHDVLSSAESVTPARTSLPMMIAIDRPEHTRLRKLVAPHFTGEAMGRRAEAIAEVVRAALDRLIEADRPDVVEHVADSVPVEVIADVLGVPRADRARFREWSDRVIEGFDVRSPRGAQRVLAATLRLHAYFRDARLGEGVLGHLAASELTDEERFWFAVLLLIAGNETTTSLIASLTLNLARDPDQLARVRADPALIGTAVEESLRHDPPIQGLYRTALRDHPVGDAVIPAGGRVLLLFAAANRDPRRYADPDRFDVARENSDHVAFGLGIHFCLGAHLARLEGAVYLRELLDRVERLELSGEPAWNGNPSMRRLVRLPVRLARSPGSARSPR